MTNQLHELPAFGSTAFLHLDVHLQLLRTIELILPRQQAQAGKESDQWHSPPDSDPGISISDVIYGGQALKWGTGVAHAAVGLYERGRPDGDREELKIVREQSKDYLNDSMGRYFLNTLKTYYQSTVLLANTGLVLPESSKRPLICSTGEEYVSLDAYGSSAVAPANIFTGAAPNNDISI